MGEERPERVLGMEDAVADLCPQLIVGRLYRVIRRYVSRPAVSWTKVSARLSQGPSLSPGVLGCSLFRRDSSARYTFLNASNRSSVISDMRR